MKQRLFKGLGFFLLGMLLFCSWDVIPVYAENLVYRTLVLGKDVVQIRPNEKDQEVYEFLFNEQVVMRYRTMSQGLSASERALVLWERVNNFGQALSQGEIKVAVWQGNYVILLDEQLLLTVTAADYLANNSTAEGLANVWATNFKKARQIKPSVEIVPEIPHKEPLLRDEEIPEVADSEEIKMWELVNAERAKAGVPPVEFDEGLAEVACLKSADLITHNYFSHHSPTYGDPFVMLKSFGITYNYAGENLAGSPTVEIAHQNLMASPGHRKNILNPNFTHLGIGIVKGGPYGQMFTQLFTG